MIVAVDVAWLLINEIFGLIKMKYSLSGWRRGYCKAQFYCCKIKTYHYTVQSVVSPTSITQSN